MERRCIVLGCINSPQPHSPLCGACEALLDADVAAAAAEIHARRSRRGRLTPAGWLWFGILVSWSAVLAWTAWGA